MVLEGLIEVNGRTVRNPDLWLDLRIDHLSRKGRPLKTQEKIYLALHKPVGIVTTRSDERGRRTVYDLLPPDFHWVFPVGRLDKDSSGLLLLTNDTEFGEAVTSPARKIEKRYRAVLDHSLTEFDKHQMEIGMILPDGTSVSGAVIVPQLNQSEYEIVIAEGRNRQIRRMCESLGYEVRRLHRLSIGDIHLGELQEGKYRSLSAQERASIFTHY